MRTSLREGPQGRRSNLFLSHSPEQTQRLGMELARQLRAGDVIALIGEIGAGKTTFVQGMAAGLGVSQGSVASPSFVLIREYRGRIPIYHADLFRLEGLAEAATVGLEEYYDGDGVTVIEWANRLPQLLPPEYLEIQFDLVNAKSRRLHVTPHGERYEGRFDGKAAGR